MSLASLLSIARSSLIVQQRAMEVTAHNVANANTPGYSRQTLRLTSATPLQMPMYTLGRGVEGNTIERARDVFYDAAYRRDYGSLGRSNTLNDYLTQIEGTLNEPSTDGLSAALDGMFGSLNDLAGDAANTTNRDLVVTKASRVVQQLHSMAAQLDRVNQEAVDNMRVQVQQVNALAQQVASLNQKILASTGPNGVSADLQDQRDALVDQLSQSVGVRVMARADGTIGVTAGDTMLVDGAQATTLAVVTVGSGYGVASANGGGAIDMQSGTLSALADLTQNRLPAVRARLDQFANALVTEFNRIHRAGTTPAGGTNIDFFDPAGTSASTIQLSAAIRATSNNIAASANGAPGNGDIATQLAALATTGVASLGGATLREHFVSTASSIGIDISNAQSDISAQQTLVDHDDQSRNATSGVNVDEEMVGLIQQQQAYQAASRLISVADQMVQDMLKII